MRRGIPQMFIHPTRDCDFEASGWKRESPAVVDNCFVEQLVRTEKRINVQSDDFAGVLSSQDSGGPVYRTSTDLQDPGTWWRVLHNEIRPLIVPTSRT